MYRANEEGEEGGANAWLIPQWGGVVILNTQHDDAPLSNNTSTASVALSTDTGATGAGGVKTRSLPQEDVLNAISLFARQLEILLGLGDPPSSSESEEVRRVKLSMLKQRRILELARESTATLSAIISLVDRIENLGVGAAVKDDTETSLAILSSLLNPLSSTNATLDHPENTQSQNLDDLLTKAAQAYELSNRAFFNPDMLGLLYFPDEHKYAVYTPLFAPLLVPLLVTTVKLIKEVVASRKNKRVKKVGGRGRKSR